MKTFWYIVVGLLLVLNALQYLLRARPCGTVDNRRIALLWRISIVRFAVYVFWSVGTAYGIATYNLGWTEMNGDQRAALVVALLLLAAKDTVSFLDAAATRVRAGDFLPPDPEPLGGSDGGLTTTRKVTTIASVTQTNQPAADAPPAQPKEKTDEK